MLHGEQGNGAAGLPGQPSLLAMSWPPGLCSFLESEWVVHRTYCPSTCLGPIEAPGVSFLAGWPKETLVDLCDDWEPYS